jgi:anti-sigma regulatory factor (Ser/Thr protein kinase)
MTDKLNILIPRRLDNVQFHKILSDSPFALGGEIPQHVNIDFSDLNFVRPVGVTFLSNLALWLHRQGCKVTFSGHDRDSECMRYLDDSLFFAQHLLKKLNQNCEPRNTTFPLKKIVHSEIRPWLELSFMPWLSSRLNISEASLYVFQAAIFEIFNNIKDHTEFDVGSIFVQHFPRENSVRISIADFGVGIPATVRRVRPGMSSNGAIIEACKPNFTSQSVPGNRGVGLDYLLQTVVEKNGGSVTIFSLNGYVKFSRVNGSVISTPVEARGFCPGTTFDIDLKTDTIEVLSDDEEDLTW